jgi:hypothetical protein
VTEVTSVLDTATSVGGLNVAVVVDVEFESADISDPSALNDRIVIGEYAVPVLSPVTVIGLDVTSAIATKPSMYTV